MTALLNGRYDLGDVVGTGGMGAVRRAVDTRLGRPVAVKILRGDRVGDGVARARLAAEAKLAAGLDHPNIASVYDHDEDRDSEFADPFIVMQLVEGATLGQVLQRRRTLPEQEVRALVVGVADALTASHAAGVVHRDIKPSNIVVTGDGRPVLVDFGIATSATIDPMTETGAIVGTTEYLSPEQARGHQATAASDVYSLGVVAAQCLTGESPFKRDTPVATAMAHVADDLPPLPAQVSPSLARLVYAMTSKDPSHRPAASAVAEAARSAITVDDLRPRPGRLFVRPAARRSRVAASAGLSVAVAVLAASGTAVVTSRDGDVEMPDLVGETAVSAGRTLEESNAVVTLTTVDRPTVDSGIVVAQDVEPGTVLGPGTRVTLEVASGRMNVDAAAIEGEMLAVARKRLENRGFAVAVEQAASTRPVGTVVAISRSGRLPIGATIKLSVSRGATPSPATTTIGGNTSAGGTTTSRTDSKQGSGKNGPGNSKGRGKGAKK